MELVEETDFGAIPPSFWTGRSVASVIFRLTGLSTASVAMYAQSHSLSKLNEYEVVVATTNSQGLSLCFLRAKGHLKARVLFIPMGIVPLYTPTWRRVVYRYLLNQVALAPISRTEADFLKGCLGPEQDIDYLPFGVDLAFWNPSAEDESGGDYVLSIGNDWNRDYATLASVWRPEYPLLRVVTSLPVPPSGGNVEVVASDWRQEILSDEKVRRLFQNSRFVVLPIRQTMQPSGQSACLQAMACGKAVILSDIRGLWDRNAMRDGETCLLTPPGSVEELQKAIEELLGNPQRVAEMGRRARETVEERFNLKVMADAMKSRLATLQ